MNIPHKSVMLHEVLDIFKNIDKGVLIDCTLGFGGHSEELLKQNPNLKIIGCDKDINALNFSKKRLERFKDRVIFHKGGFSTAINHYKNENIKGVLADIGVSSHQLDEKSRGFGFESEKLDMRMDLDQHLDAFKVINSYTQQDLEEILKEYGEISNYMELARSIVQHRKKDLIYTPNDLKKIVGDRRQRGRKVSILTLVFQAIRIEVNNELGELTKLLESLSQIKPKGARVGIITFHSLEDRIVKRTFKYWTKSCICPDESFKCECTNDHNLGKIITKKPLTPSKEEIKENPRARSAKLRVFEFEN